MFDIWEHYPLKLSNILKFKIKFQLQITKQFLHHCCFKQQITHLTKLMIDLITTFVSLLCNKLFLHLFRFQPDHFHLSRIDIAVHLSEQIQTFFTFRLFKGYCGFLQKRVSQERKKSHLSTVVKQLLRILSTV